MAPPTPSAGVPTLVMTKLKVADLLRVCQKCKLPRGGLKHDLQQRVLAALRGEVQTVCTPAQVEAAVRDVYATTHGTPRLLPPVYPNRVVVAPPPRDAVQAPHPAGPSSLTVRALLSSRTPHPDSSSDSVSAPQAVGQLPSWMATVVATVKQCDPFHVQEALLLVPVKLNQVYGAKPPADWSTCEDFALMQATATVTLSPAYVEALRKGDSEVDLHICCVRLNDTVPGRLCWPCHASCTLNGITCTVPVRRRANDLGPRGRDKPATLPPAIRGRLPASGPMSLSLVACGYDTRPFAVCVILVKRLSLQAVATSVPAAASPQSCLARCVAAMAPHDDDIASSAVGLSLRDPLSGARIRTPVRYAACSGLAVFDLDAFLALAQQSLQWTCPLCTACGPPTQLVHDTYVAAILKVLELSGESEAVDEVLVSPDGAWQARLTDGALGRLVSPHETLGVAAGTQAAQATAVHDPAAVMQGSPLLLSSPGGATAPRPRARLPTASPPEVIVIGSSSDDEDDGAGGGEAAAAEVGFGMGRKRRLYNPGSDEHSSGSDDVDEEDDGYGWLASSLADTYGSQEPEEERDAPDTRGIPHVGWLSGNGRGHRLVVPLHAPAAPHPLVPRLAPTPASDAAGPGRMRLVTTSTGRRACFTPNGTYLGDE
jgi:hypothetical protein